MVNVFFNYKLQLKFEICTGGKTKYDSLLSMDYLPFMIFELTFIFLHPNYLTIHSYYEYTYTESDGSISTTNLRVNDILMIFVVLRLYYVFRYVLSISKFFFAFCNNFNP